MGMVNICMVLETSMRHRVRSVARNATKPVTLLPLMTNVRRQPHYEHIIEVLVVLNV
jgi:hypothetical protein